jgi:putative oxidoreductase
MLRVILGLVMIEHGLMKLIGFPASAPGVPSPLPTLLLVGALLETVLGAFLTIGLFTRVAAFVLSGEMAVAYFMVHAPASFWPAVNGGELAAVLSFALLAIAGRGPDRYTLDAFRTRER